MVTGLSWTQAVSWRAFPWLLDSPELRLWVGGHFHGYWTLLNSGCELAGISMVTGLSWTQAVSWLAFPWLLDSPELRLWVGGHFHGYWTLLNSGCELAGISMVTGLSWTQAELTGISMAPTITAGLDPGPSGWKENWPHLIWCLFGLGGVVALSTHRTNVDTVYYWEGFWAHGHFLAVLVHIQRQSYTFRDCSTCSMRLWWSPTTLVLFTMLA